MAFGILEIRTELVRSRIYKSRLKEMLQKQSNGEVAADLSTMNSAMMAIERYRKAGRTLNEAEF